MSEEKITVTDESLFMKAQRLNVNDKIKEKNKLKYLSWSSAWALMKTIYPDATYRIIKTGKDLFFEAGVVYIPEGNNYHTDGKTCYVEVEITADELTQSQELAIMDFKNQSIPLASIKSTDVQKSIARCLAKCCALFGIGIYIYEGEDLPTEAKVIENLHNEINELYKKKLVQLGSSEEAKNRILEICEKGLPDDLKGNWNLCEDSSILEVLKKELMKVRK